MGKIFTSVAFYQARYNITFQVTGRVAGTTATSGTMVFSATEDLTVEALGDVSIVSVTRAADSIFRVHTVVFNCTNAGFGGIRVQNAGNIRSLGNHRGALDPSINFYTGVDATAPILNWNLNLIPANVQKIRQFTSLENILPTTGGNGVFANLTYLNLVGANINVTYSGNLNNQLGLLWLENITGSFTITNALNQNIRILWLASSSIHYSNSANLSPMLSILTLNGNNINITGQFIGNNLLPQNFNHFQLLKYRNPSSTLTASQLITMLTNIKNNTGTLPATIRIREYNLTPAIADIQSAVANQNGTDAEKIKYWLTQVLTGKGCTTIELNTTNFTL